MWELEHDKPYFLFCVSVWRYFALPGFSILIAMCPMFMATWIGLSRINDYQNHLSDVLAGAAIGTAWAICGFVLYRNEFCESSTKHDMLVEQFTNDMKETLRKYILKPRAPLKSARARKDYHSRASRSVWFWCRSFVTDYTCGDDCQLLWKFCCCRHIDGDDVKHRKMILSHKRMDLNINLGSKNFYATPNQMHMNLHRNYHLTTLSAASDDSRTLEHLTFRSGMPNNESIEDQKLEIQDNSMNNLSRLRYNQCTSSAFVGNGSSENNDKNKKSKPYRQLTKSLSDNHLSFGKTIVDARGSLPLNINTIGKPLGNERSQSDPQPYKQSPTFKSKSDK